MPRYMVERNLWGVGEWPPERLRELAESFRSAAEREGPGVAWVHSYVTPDTVYCVYEAPDAEAVRRLIHRPRTPPAACPRCGRCSTGSSWACRRGPERAAEWRRGSQ